jgi:hypothetical protein
MDSVTKSIITPIVVYLQSKGVSVTVEELLNVVAQQPILSTNTIHIPKVTLNIIPPISTRNPVTVPHIHKNTGITIPPIPTRNPVTVPNIHKNTGVIIPPIPTGNPVTVPHIHKNTGVTIPPIPTRNPVIIPHINSNPTIRMTLQVKTPIPNIQKQSNDIVTESDADIFDFDKYNLEYNIMSEFFTGLELYLRTALFIDYKYNHLSPNDRKIIDHIIETQETREKKHKFLESMFNVMEPEYIMTHWFRHFAPDVIQNKPNVVNNILDRYGGFEDIAFNRMYKKRVDHDWRLRPLWFSTDKKWYDTHTK